MVKITNAVCDVISQKAREALKVNKEKLLRKYSKQKSELSKRWFKYKEISDLFEEFGFSVCEDTIRDGRWYNNGRVDNFQNIVVAKLNQLPPKATLEEAYEIADKLIAAEIKKMLKKE